MLAGPALDGTLRRANGHRGHRSLAATIKAHCGARPVGSLRNELHTFVVRPVFRLAGKGRRLEELRKKAQYQQMVVLAFMVLILKRS